ncbi:FAD-binding and (Fe-S)-binding domain-containing protein [Acidocella facilis]|uniref:FAD-binding and (Fe-S)-binding domain-containing protein n=1 Tax=Acidocella facilis TaxID=525 RepID=UPI001F3DB91D|nr:FAD-binding and (Fe-S)-binding domain-containing protein [Acidocella facilis]
MDGMGVEMDQVTRFASALRQAGFGGEVETEAALRVAMSTDNSVYQIMPDVIVAPRDAADMARLASVLDQPAFHSLGVTARGGGTGTNGQSLNRGVIVDTRRHMNRVLAVDAQAGWADVEPGVVLDALNDALRPSGWFFAPETSTSTRCTIGGMVSTDASGKGSRVYGKTSDNIIGLELARPEGLLSSLAAPPEWATGMLARAEAAARAGRAAFIAHTPRLNRRFTGYDLERACPEAGGFEWWRLFLGAEGTLGLISRIRVKLRRIEPEKRLLVVGFGRFRQALAAAGALMAFAPTAIEVMDERVQALAGEAGILARLPLGLRAGAGQRLAYVFIEFNGTDGPALEARLAACLACLEGLEGARAVHMAQGLAEIKALWAIRSAGVGLLGKIQGAARPVAFVEDCVVPPENLPAFLDEFLAVLEGQGLEFGIYGHVDVGCLHVRPALNIDSAEDRQKLGAVSDAVFALTRKYGGVFWGEHGKGVRGAYLRAWIGEEAYAALRQVKAAFDPQGRFNPGKLVTGEEGALGILTTPFRPFNAPEGDALAGAFRCNGNAQCLSYEASTPMCPSYKVTADLRQSPKGRADALRDWHRQRQSGPADPALEAGLLATLDGCLGCKACASTCPVQVDVPGLRSAFYADYYARHARPLADRLALLGERLSPALAACAPVLRPVWPVLGKLGGVLGMLDLPRHYAPKPPRRYRLDKLPQDATALGARPVVLVQDWFSALFDGAAQRDAIAGLEALGYRPWLLKLHPAGKVAQTFGALPAFMAMATRLCAALSALARLGVPLVGLDPALVMQLRQDYPKAGLIPPSVALPQEFLVRELEAGRVFPQAAGSAPMRLFSHCTESTAVPAAGALWRRVYEALGLEVETPSTGCCGMAGLFGHQERHQRVSRRLFDLSWRAKLEGEAEMAASGFSCRCQAERLAGKQLRHPLGLIAQALAGKTP